MNVAVLADAGNADGTIGGAELTMREFILSAPDTITLVDDLAAAEAVVIGNCVTFDPSILPGLRGKHVIRYHNDLARHEARELRWWLEDHALHVFTSPLHQRLYGLDGAWPNIPPAVDLDAFRPNGELEREGACAIAPWQNTGKGQQLVKEWSENHEPVDVYGGGPFIPHGPMLNVEGPIPPGEVAATLWRYERFVHLPTAPEPFGRAVVEAWAAGCELIVNRLVGALHYIENEPEKLTTASADFWSLVTDARVAA